MRTGEDRMADKLLVGAVVAVSRNGVYQFSKPVRESIHLIAGLGVEGDAHLGVTVRHRSRVAKDPTWPNLRQVQRESHQREVRHVAPRASGAPGGDWATLDPWQHVSDAGL